MKAHERVQRGADLDKTPSQNRPPIMFFHLLINDLDDGHLTTDSIYINLSIGDYVFKCD